MFALSFHVDYWDRLGWKDPFGDKAFSNRQRSYARAFQSQRVYTPQVIVNGRTEVVGSSRSKVRGAIGEAMKAPARAAVTLSRRGAEVAYAVEGATDGALLNVVVVEDRQTVEVGRGENSGRTLKHANVVRWFQAIPLAKGVGGAVEVALPKGSARVIAYVQDPKTMAISGAVQLPLTD